MILIGDGGLFPLLLFLAMFVLLPYLFLRGIRRAVLLPPGEPMGGWQVGGPGPYGPQGGWELPQEPVLPPVSPGDVVSLRDRLGHDVRTLDPGADPVSRQAMADASERLSTCSTLLERAGSQAQLRTAWLAAVEGLTATRLVRTRLGLDPGPPIPTPPTGPRLQAPTRIDVDGRSRIGSPDYEPGRPHWFPGGAYGGRYVPGGWYDAPFWPSGLILGGLGGFALGSLAAGAMFDDAYDGLPGYGDGVYGDPGYGDGVYGDGGYGDGGYGDPGYGDGSYGGGGWEDGGGWGGGEPSGGGWEDGGGWSGGDSGGGWGGGDSGGGGE